MTMLREVVFLLLVILVLYEAVEYYAVNSAKLTLVEPVGAVGGSRIIVRVYYENPAPLPVYVLNLTLNVECDGTVMNSQIANFSLPAGGSGGLFVSMRAEQPPRGTCAARASAELTTSLLRIVRMPVARRSVTSSFESSLFGSALLWAGWNTTWIEAGKCAEVIVLASPGVSYTAYVLEDSPGKPSEKKMEFSGQGNATRVFCAPVGASPLVVRGYFIALESRDLEAAWTQSNNYPPRLKLRG